MYYVLVYYIYYYYHEKTMSPPLIIIANPTAANDITIRSCAAATMNIPQSVCVLVGAICLLKKPRAYCVCGVFACVVSGRPSPTKIKNKNHKDNRKRRPVNSISYLYYSNMLGIVGVGEEHRHRDYNTSCDTWPRRKF